VYREAERGFLVGAIAGLMTKRQGDPKINPDNHVIGIVAGMDIPLANASVAGFMAGPRLRKPVADVRYSYGGHWADPARGKELALALIAQGADIIWGAAGLSGLGAIQAAQESNRYAIGADSDQGHLAPGHILTNGMKLVNNTVFLAVESVVNGTFQPGVHVLGVKENVLGYSPSLVPDDGRAVVDALAQRIASGELMPPENIPDVEAWLAANRYAIAALPGAGLRARRRVRGLTHIPVVEAFRGATAGASPDLHPPPGEFTGIRKRSGPT